MASSASRGKSKVNKSTVTRVLPLDLDFLKTITDQFSKERILGIGAFGTVYKGIMPDGETIAVKKLAENSPIAREKAFANEVQNIILQHENVVRIVGYCHEAQKKVVQNNGRYIAADIVESLLCYEHLSQGSLQKNLFEVSSKMDWATRFKIIKGICRGLLFLHSIPIVHMDLMPDNILLDDNMEPKIADFGLSRLFGQGQTRMNTSNVVQAYGYVAPEYVYRGEISTMSDIYSLGLLIMETSTGEKNCPSDEPTAVQFIKKVRENWTEEHIASEYPSLNADCLRQVKQCIQIGLECVEIDRRERPSIETIIGKLDGQISSGYGSLLSLQHERLHFPMEPKRLMSSSMYLKNSTDDYVAFRLATNISKKYLTKLPFCGFVPPKCTYTITVMKREQKKPSPSISDDFLTLHWSIAHTEDHEDVDPDSVDEFLEMSGDEVQEVKVTVVAGEIPAETISNQIIDGQNYREVLSVDVHPTEPWILTSNQRGYICIWNYQTQKEMNSLEVTREPVYSAKFIEREGWLVVGGGDGYIYVYNNDTTEEVDPIEAHDCHSIMSLAVNQTQSLVLSSSGDHTIKLWDWKKGWECIQIFEGHDNDVTHVMFDPRNSENFASASLDQTVKIWNIDSASCIITWDGHMDGLLCLQYCPRYFQQFLISGSSDGAAKIWDLQTDSCVQELQGHGKILSALCWHPELRVLVTGSHDGTVQIWM